MANIEYDEYQSKTGFTYFWGRLKTLFYNRTETDNLLSDKVDKVNGKGLSTNDYDDAAVTKLQGIEAGAEANDIDTISVNNVPVASDLNKNVNITVPTATSQLTNDSSYQTASEVAAAIDNAIGGIEGITYNFDYASVAELPTVGEQGTIYFIPEADSFQTTSDTEFQEGKEYFELVDGNYIHTTDETMDSSKTYYELKSGTNRFEEYVWSTKYQSYEKFGSAAINTDNLWTKSNLVAMTTAEIDAILNS